MRLFLAFLLVPLIEIALFIQVGGLIGLWPTLAIVVLTAVLGTYMVKAEGRAAINNLRRAFETLDDPSEPLAHGAMILISGALLLTPGFFTDAVGFALLVPGVRSAAFHWLKTKVKVQRFEMGTNAGPQRPTHDPRRPTPGARHGGGEVIEGDYTEVSDDKRPNHPGSGWTQH